VASDHPLVGVFGQLSSTTSRPASTRVEVWRELLGKMTQEVEVKADAPTKVTFEMSKK
jgi:hypothetical protein